MSAKGARLRRAALLGAAAGPRTFLGPAALALRGRLGTRRPAKVAKFVLPALAAGELVGDKLPSAPPRVEGGGLVGRVLAGAFSGRVVAGGPGARAGAAFALASTYPTQALRAMVVRRAGIPDAAYAAPEDLATATLATAASADPDVDGPKTGPSDGFSARQREERAGIGAAAARGVAAALVGTAAMTSSQYWVYGLFGGAASMAPAEVGEKILGRFGVKVRKQQRPALNNAMHLLYGTSWGLPFGLAFGRGERPPGPGRGLAFGTVVWIGSLVDLPALGVAEPIWRQPPEAMLRDLGFHLVYGLATAAAYESLAD